MPVSLDLADSNQTQTERLRRLVQRLDLGTLAVRLPNGWTVAGALAHIAFWDRSHRKYHLDQVERALARSGVLFA